MTVNNLAFISEDVNLESKLSLLSELDVKKIMISMFNIFCIADHMHTNIVKNMLEVILPIVTKIENLSI